MKNIPRPGEIIRKDITAATGSNNSKVAERLERARALRADLDVVNFDVIDIDALKRAGRDIKDIS